MPRPLHIALAGPVATADVESLLPGRGPWPAGSPGAPFMATLVHELLRRGHRVSVLTLSSDLPLRAHKRQGSRVSVAQHGFGLTWCPMRPKGWPWMPTGAASWLPGRVWDSARFERQHLRTALLALKPDLVHAHWAYEYALAALRSGLPHLVSCHDLPRAVLADQALWRNRVFRWLWARMARAVMRRADAVTAPSPWLAEALAADRDGPRVPVTVLPNPLPPALFAGARPRAPAGRLRVLMVNHGFGAAKNVGAGLAAFARFAGERPAAELVLLGDGMGPGQAAERWWRESGLAGADSRVRFAGPVAHTVVQHWMRQSDLLLHPSLVEAFGMAVAEAMALGVPVLAGAASGALPWVTGGHARLVDVRSADAIAEALLEWAVDRERDPAGAAERAARARRAIEERFAAPRIGDALEALYRSRLAEEPPGSRAALEAPGSRAAPRAPGSRAAPQAPGARTVPEPPGSPSRPGRAGTAGGG